ncbi:MAG TPA: nucleotidyltransferase domain-containing protein [Rectinemataceae bacterium]|nr:nucleotidyltransferase domain-containing protein [Rectinemataceae bacterium]
MGSEHSPSVPPEFIHAMAENARRGNAREAEAAARRLEEARSEAKRLATELAALSGIKRVILFGSAARGRGFRTDSDIDLAIDGGDVLEAMRVVESSAFHVDIVDLENANEAIRARVEAEGVTLYET